MIYQHHFEISSQGSKKIGKNSAIIRNIDQIFLHLLQIAIFFVLFWSNVYRLTSGFVTKKIEDI